MEELSPSRGKRPESRRSGFRALGVSLVALLAVFLVAEVTARRATASVPEDWGVERIGFKVDQITTIDQVTVVFAGDSMAEVGLDPDRFTMLTGSPAYNAALTAAPPRVWALWTGEYVLPELVPDIVVVGIGSFSMNDAQEIRPRLLESYLGSPERRDYVGEDVGLIQELLQESALYRHRTALRSPEEWAGRGAPTISPSGRELATSDVAYIVTEGYERRLTQDALAGYTAGGPDLRAVESLVAGVEAAGARPVIVVMPIVAADHIPMHPRGAADHAQFDRLVDVLEENRVTVLRPPAALFPAEVFADPIHLNRHGTERLTDWVAAALSGPEMGEGSG
ncbi:MAG: hypothetical protein ACE5GC_03455 [Acidimicrobiia bacterium]